MNKLFLEVLIQFKKIILFILLGFSITIVEAQCISGNCINGEGTFVYKDGSKFIGNFENGKKLFGKYTYPSGAIYEGYFKNEKRDSIGRFNYQNGDFFDGIFLNDQKLFGTYSYNNGNEFRGAFKDNKPHGFGEFKNKNGVEKEGFWNDGIPDWNVVTDSIHLNENRTCTLDIDGFSKETPKSETPRIFALVIGVSDYYGTEADLRFADTDAKHFYNHLQNAFPKEIKNGECKLLINHHATASNIKNQLKNIFSKATENDYVIFYFSGHGNKGVIIPADIPNQISYSDVKAAFKYSKAKYKLSIIDACYAGSIEQINSISNYNNQQMLREFRLAVLSSSSSNQLSSESIALGQGLFSYWLIKGMNGAADLNNDKYITAGELFVYTRKAVAEKSGGKQVPTVIGQNLDKIPLCRIK
jgi:hypothetical protein